MKSIFALLSLWLALPSDCLGEQIQGSREVLALVALDDAGRLVGEFKSRLEEKKRQEPAFITIAGLVEQLGLTTVRLYLLKPKDQPVRLALVATDPGSKALTGLVTNPLIVPYLQKKAEGSYSLKWDAIPKAKDVPEEHKDLELTSHEGNLLFSHASVIARIRSGALKLDDSLAARLIVRTREVQSLVSVALALPAELDEGWMASIRSQKGLPRNFVVQMAMGMAEKLVNEIVGTLKAPAMAASFDFDGKDGRQLRYLHVFAGPKEAEAALKELSRKTEDPDIQDFAYGLADAVETQKLNRTMRVDGSMLAMALAWPAGADKAMSDAVGGATIGHVMARSFGIRPSEQPVAPVYVPGPQLGVSLENIQAQLTAKVKDAIFPAGYVKRGESTQVTLEIDPPEIPNAGLSHFSYEILSVKTKDGQDAKGEPAKPRHSRRKPGALMSLGRGHTDRISVPVKDGVKPEDLGAAEVLLKVQSPKLTKPLVFSAGDPKGKALSEGKDRFRLHTLENDVIILRTSASGKPQVFALDETGKFLDKSASSAGGGKIAAKYKGKIEKVWVFPNVETEEVTATVEADLNGGQRLKLPKEPSTDVRVRYARKLSGRAETYEPCDGAALDQVRVEWDEEHRGRLRMKVPPGGSNVTVDFHCNWLGKDGPLSLSGNKSWQGRDYYWHAQGGNGLSEALGVVGVAHLGLHTDFGILEFGKAEGWQVRKLSHGGEVKVRIELNQVTRQIPEGSTALELKAFNADGRALRASGWSAVTNQREERRSYWGAVERVRLVVSQRKIEKAVPFEILKGPAAQTAFEALKKRVAAEQEVEAELKAVTKVMRTWPRPTFEHFAGLYYVFNDKGEPQKKIPQEMAQANKAGAERFQYEPKPYKGYTFRMLDEYVQGGKQQKFGTFRKKAKWAGGEGEIGSRQQTAFLISPVDPKCPTYVINQHGQLFKKYLQGQAVEVLPDLWKDKWQQIK